MVRPKKHLGQHFLRDENIARKIICSLDPAFPLVLEVGPGTGVLTKYLLADPSLDPWFMEVDREAFDHLSGSYPGIAGRLILADFLDYDLAGFPPQGTPAAPSENSAFPGKPLFSVIGNFPYNISSQILFRVLEHHDRIPEVVGMFQKEVAERLAAPPGNKTYGILTVLLKAFYDTEYLFTVNESVFYPPPRVKSAVIRLRRNNVRQIACDEIMFFRVVKTAFNQRRKTLRNALRSLTGPEAGAGSAVLARWLDKRAEQLSVDDFISLAAEISTFA